MRQFKSYLFWNLVTFFGFCSTDSNWGPRKEGECQGKRVDGGKDLVSRWSKHPTDGGSSSAGSPTGRVSAVSPTAVRRNITQRRSKGKTKDEGDTLPLASLLSRRPRSRSKDWRYSLESTGIEAACENQDWRHTSARFQPPQTSDGTCQVFPYSATDPDQGYRFRRGHSASSSSPENEGKRIEFDDRENIEETGKDLPHLAYRVPSSTNVREVPTSPSWPFSLSRLDTAAPFLQEFIPAQDFHPELHQTLTRLWYDRQEAVRELGDALGKDDSARYTTLQSEVTVINTRMHTTLQHVVERFPHLINDGDSYSSRENNESSVQSLDPITAVSSRHIPTKSKEDPSLNEQIQ